ncbi:hypothetical protein H0486_17280 [Lachnospiraceae bacterium MD1]|uniref:Tetratricopeptide repeat protein n=1 Tax=Variimorphobacter saccharofermentans TaxID=2755051 RepID=A0A839K4S7_9FIRM|nr:hypothetical protein [Variimorphobacter saccharofermentans]MBB2184626.1 hypothetical protein [Variimorphobacter saccharofermentans]
MKTYFTSNGHKITPADIDASIILGRYPDNKDLPVMIILDAFKKSSDQELACHAFTLLDTVEQVLFGGDHEAAMKCYERAIEIYRTTGRFEFDQAVDEYMLTHSLNKTTKNSTMIFTRRNPNE